MFFYSLFFYIVVSVSVFLFFKFLLYIIRIVIFKLLIDRIVNFVFDDEEEDDGFEKKKDKKSNKTDFLARDKNKENFVDVKKETNIDEEKRYAKQRKTRIVGVNFDIKGKFTKMVVEKLLGRINIQALAQENTGFYEAMLKAQRAKDGVVHKER